MRLSIVFLAVIMLILLLFIMFKVTSIFYDYNNHKFYTYIDTSSLDNAVITTNTIIEKMNEDTLNYYISEIKEILQYENIAKLARERNIIPKQEYNPYNYTSTDINKNGPLPFSLEMFKEAKVDFPEIHYIIFFKETSFCRGFYNNNKNISLCSHELIDILGFNPYNGSGMKWAPHRARLGQTTAVGSIGMITTKNCKSIANGHCLPKGYERFYTDPHAVFTSPMDHCVDIKMWQDYWYRVKKYKPKTAEEYIQFLEKVGYNPYQKYYHGSKGLIMLYKMYKSKDFTKTYNKYYEDRIEKELDNFFY